MLCLKTFEQKPFSSFASSKEWGDFVHSNWQYALSNSTPYDWIGKCTTSDLPSFHPYWRVVVTEQKQQSLNKKREQLKECKLNPELLKYYFRLGVTIESISIEIEEEQASIDKYIATGK